MLNRCISNKAKGFVALVLIVAAASSMLFAADGETVVATDLSPYSDRDVVKVSLSDLPGDESAHFAFMYGFQAILEGKCDGAVLGFDSGNEYIAGYLAPGSPDDFCTRISPDTIAVSEPVMKETMMLMYSMLGDRESLSNLMAFEDDALVAVVMFRPVDGLVLPPVWYAEAERKIEDASVAQGLNPDEFYAIMGSMGYSKDSLVASVSDGVDASDMVLDAVKAKADSEKTDHRDLVSADALVIGAIVLGVIALVLDAVYVGFRAFERKRNPRDDDMEG